MQKQLPDQEIMADILASQKQAASSFNMFATECVCPDLKKDMLNILREEQGMQTNVFEEMQRRGWYPTNPAQQQMVDQARTKFEGISQSLS